MHPDERNMVNATQQLRCDVSGFRLQVSWFKQCLNPHFFAYGQLPLYLAYFFLKIAQFVTGTFGNPLLFDSIALSLRMIAAAASVLTFFVTLRIVNLLRPLKFWETIAVSLILIFVPYAIQFSHFGTTESILMLLYTSVLYQTLKIIKQKITMKSLFVLGIILGVAIGIKSSSVLFAAAPSLVLFFHILFKKQKLPKKIIDLTKIFLIIFVATAAVAILTSPHNIINWGDFLGAMRYESDVALGQYRAFYTRQFEYARPIIFQLGKIFPYVFGLPQFILFLLGFFLFGLRDRKLNIVRLFILFYFIPSALVYAKWTRFVSPVFPMMSVIIAILVIDKINFLIKLKGKIKNVKSQVKSQKFVFWMVNIFCIFVFSLFLLPGAAYLSVYTSPDARFKASDWIYQNIPENSLILSETANVVDIPLSYPDQKIMPKNYQVISFDFYNLDEQAVLMQRLQQYLASADYIFVPSRRIFANHTCFAPDDTVQIQDVVYEDIRCRALRQKYPVLHQYYQDLFSGASGFMQVAEISSFPRISIFGKTLLEFDDEQAEETWTVFDHPVVRIYKRI